MDALPSELLSRVVFFATLDGGQTASTLLCVSKYVSAVAERYRFHSVQVFGLAQIERLCKTLREARAGKGGIVMGTMVKHLFVSDLSEGSAKMEFVDRVVRNVHEDLYNEALDLKTAYEALLTLVAPSLETLMCLVFNPYMDPFELFFQATSFPHLSNLSVRFTAPSMRYPSLATPSHDIRIAPSAMLPLPVMLPTLTHLHLAFTYEPALSDEPIRLVVKITENAPNLAQLRFTNVRFSRECVATLGEMLEVHSVRLPRSSVSRLSSHLDSDSDSDLEEISDSDSDPVELDSSWDDYVSEGLKNLIPVLPQLTNIFVQPGRTQNIPWWSSFQTKMLALVKDIERTSLDQQGERDGKVLTVLPQAKVGTLRQWERNWRLGLESGFDFGLQYGNDEENEYVKDTPALYRLLNTCCDMAAN